MGSFYLFDNFRENQRKFAENVKEEEEKKAKEKEGARFSSSFGGISSFSRFRR